MPTSHTTTELLNVVEKRIEILDHLRADAHDTRDLVDALEISRSTVNRGLRELQTWGLIEYHDGEYAITYSGRLAVQKFHQFRTSLEQLNRLNPILRHFPATALDVPIEALATGQLSLADAARPNAPTNHHSDTLADAETARLLHPLLGVTTLDVICEQPQPADRQIELIVSPPIAERMAAMLQANQGLADLHNTDSLKIFVSEAETPYFLGIMDQHVQLGVENEHGTPHALLEATHPDFQDWAGDKYDEHKHHAEQLSQSQFHVPRQEATVSHSNQPNKTR